MQNDKIERNGYKMTKLKEMTTSTTAAWGGTTLCENLPKSHTKIKMIKPN